MRRSFPELVEWLLRDNPVPAGSVLLTGTGLVPPDDFTLEPATRSRSRSRRSARCATPSSPRADLTHNEKERDPCLRSSKPRRGPAFANFVGGEWRPSVSGKTYEKRNPWRPAETVGEFPASGEADVNAAVEAAAAAFPEWSRRPGRAARGDPERRRRRDRAPRRADRAGHDARDGQAAARGAHGVGAHGAQILRFFAGEAWRPKGELYEQSATGGAVYTIRRPLGVVGLITPWNFPAAIPAWKSAPALIYGNTVVMKLAQEAPLTGLHLAACFDEAGMPAGVFNIVVGRGSEVGTPLVSTRTCGRSRSPAPSPSASRCATRRPRSASASSSSSAARTR